MFVLFTAGKQTNIGKPIIPKDAARLLKDLGVQIVVVEFGQTDKLVTSVSSNPTEDLKIRGWFTQQSLWANICRRLKGDAECQLPSQIDIGFLIDSSASVKKGYKEQLKFVGDMASSFGLSKYGHHASAVVYSNRADVHIPLTDGMDTNLFKTKITNAPYMGLDCRFERALERVRNSLFDPKQGARPKVPKLAIIITDGRHSDKTTGASVADQAAQLKALGTHVFVIAVGNAVDPAELMEIASKDGVYFTDNFGDLRKASVRGQPGPVETIKGLICPNLRESKIMGVKPVVPVGPVDGTLTICPLDKDLQTMKLMVDQGMNPSWIAKFFWEMKSLKKMVNYYKELKEVLEYLPPSVLTGGKTDTLIEGATMAKCRDKLGADTINRVFDDSSGSDILAKARENGGGKFVDLLWASGLASDMLKTGDQYAIVVPSDEAFKKISNDVRFRMADNCYLRQLLKYHISKLNDLNTTVATNDLTSQLEGKLIRYKNKDGVTSYGGSIVLKPKISASNGHVIIVDNLMTPPSQ